MKTSNQGVALIKRFEGCVLKAYKAVASEEYWTIGYGHYGRMFTRGISSPKSAPKSSCGEI